MGVRIITDSTCDLSQIVAAGFGVEMASLKVNFGDEEYVDKVTISNEEFYEKLAVAKELPTTTLVNVEEFISVFEKYPDDDIVGIFISSKLSGTCQSAQIAKDTLGRGNIYIIDSGSVTIGLSLLVLEAVRLKNQGESGEAIAKKIQDMSQKVKIYAAIDTLKYLIMGGRLNAASGIVGSVLGLKPIICVYDGVITSVDKARGMKKGIASLAQIVKEKCKVDHSKKMLFAHSNNPEGLETLIEQLNLRDVSEMDKLLIGSVVGTHAGPGAVAIAFFEE
jgi:DegV family protein with EDD domain